MGDRYLCGVSTLVRIIGIDLNPAAKHFDKYGFEIFIGDQADPKFWRSFIVKLEILMF